MKQIKHYLLTVLVALVSSISVSAYDFEVDGIYYNVLSKDDLTCEVTYQSSDFNSYSGDFIIPASVTYNGRTFTVSKIGDSAFKYSGGLFSVTIPNSVTAIESWAFYGCSELTSVIIPNSVTYIGKCAFFGDPGLTSVTIGNGVEIIGGEAFGDCWNLTSVTIGNSVRILENHAFYNCSNLTSVTLPNSVIYIGANAFYQCTALISITIPNSVENIVNGAFYSCSNLKEITSLNIKPPYIENLTVFEGISKIDCVVRVPARALKAYQSADGWKEFWNFEAIPSDESENTLYEGTADEITEEGDLAAAKNMIEKSTASNALVLSTTEVSNVSDIPMANITAINNEGNYVAKEIRLTDAEPFYCPMNVTAEQITYTRDFATTDWQAFYIPFAMSYDDWSGKAEIAKILGIHVYDDRTIMEFRRLKAGEATLANTPYVIKPNATSEVTFSCTDKTLEATANGSVWCATTEQKYTLTGVYQETPINGKYALINGSFYQVTSDNPQHPFRFYLTVEDVDNGYGGSSAMHAPRKIQLMVDGEIATGLEDVTEAESSTWFDLSGRKVAHPQHGIYIKNNKKVVVK